MSCFASVIARASPGVSFCPSIFNSPLMRNANVPLFGSVFNSSVCLAVRLPMCRVASWWMSAVFGFLTAEAMSVNVFSLKSNACCS